MNKTRCNELVGKQSKSSYQGMTNNYFAVNVKRCYVVPLSIGDSREFY